MRTHRSSHGLLVHIGRAKQEILAAGSIVKVKSLWNKAEAVRQLGQAARDPDLITYATEFKLRCERRLGEMLAAMKEAGEIREGRPWPRNNCTDPRTVISETGIDRNLSSRAQRLFAAPEEQFEAAVAEAKAGEAELTRRAVERLLDLSLRHDRDARPSPPLPAGKFRVIYADPPWAYRNSGLSQSADGQYSTLAPDQICSLTPYGRPILDIAGDDAVLFLWVTAPNLPDGLAVMAAWGFEYVENMIWRKDRAPGMGWWLRVVHELLLIGRRGAPGIPQDRPLSVIDAPVQGHSRKPDEVYSLIESMFPGPYIELFARRPRDGWTAWGNEIEAS